MPHPFPAPGPAKARFQSSDFWKVFASFQGGETISCEKTKTTSNLIQTKNHLKIFLLRHVRPNREMLLLLPSKRWSQVHRDVSDRCWHRRDDLQHHHPPHQQPGETLRLRQTQWRRPSSCSQSYHETLGRGMPNYTWYMVGEILGYSVLIITNFALVIGAAKKNRQGFFVIFFL